MSLSFNPVGNWFVVAAFAAVVTGLTLWAYRRRIQGGSGAWRWVALGLRLAAVLLCLVAALRPSVVYEEKRKQAAALLFLIDASSSMRLADEAGGRTRWELARKTLGEGRAAGLALGDGLVLKSYRFDIDIRDDLDDPSRAGAAAASPGESAEKAKEKEKGPAKGKDATKDRDPDKDGPSGRGTALGQALLEAVRREAGVRVAAVVLLSDGANNGGIAPLTAARQLKAKDTPVVAVGFGSENAGSKSKDVAVRNLVAGPTVFVKNQLQVKGSVLARGYAGQSIDLEMYVEGADGKDELVATQRLKVPEGSEDVPISGLKYIPQTPGEKKVTLRVKPKDGELIWSNNQVSSFVTVLAGGLNVLFVQGPHAPWEGRFWLRSVATSPDIQADLRILRKPATRTAGELKDEDFAPNRYNVYVLSDLPANFLTADQTALLARAVERGAGLIMLGGRSSFGPGGWGSTELARVLPVEMRSGDGQVEPEGGVKFTPNPRALDGFLLQVGADRADTARVWAALPPLSGINHLGALKKSALVMGETPGARPEPIMVGEDVGGGRSLAFGGETWVWARAREDEGRLAHRKFWRQVIFWLAHREDKGDNEVKLKLDARRIDVGQKLDFGVTARDPKGEPIPGLKYETTVEALSLTPTEGATAPVDPKAPKFSERITDLFRKGDEARGSFYADRAPPGDYRVSVVATRDGKEVGRDASRFLIYQDDRELENPAADRALLRQIAEASGGESLPPEQLPRFLKSLKGKLATDTYSQTERKVWDNWPFFLLFATLLMLEWFVRKRHGWV